MDKLTVEKVADIDRSIILATRCFFNSASAGGVYDPILGHVFGETELCGRDILVVGVLSGCHVLLAGETARGKTELAKLVCQGAFGEAGWHLLRLTPHVNEDTFANIDMQKLADSSVRDAVTPAPFLSHPGLVLDELNRAPAPLTNILLGLCDGQIELKCGVKYSVGHSFQGRDGHQQRYQFICGTLNEGREYVGTFQVDPALRRRFTLQLPLDDLCPTPDDVLNIVETRIGPAPLPDFESAIDQVTTAHERILDLPLDPLATVYLLYLGNVGRCPYHDLGRHPQDTSQELCTKTECRIQKIADAFCPSVSGFNEGLLVYLKRAACGLAALRIARTVAAIRQCISGGSDDAIDELRKFVGTNATGNHLRRQVTAKYLESSAVTAGDIRTMAPFVGIGGKVWLSEPYVAKHFGGSAWLAMQHYVRHTYSGLESFFRQHQTLFREISNGNGAVEKLIQRARHAERFSDPYVLPSIRPLLSRNGHTGRSPQEIDELLNVEMSIRQSAEQLVDPN